MTEEKNRNNQNSENEDSKIPLTRREFLGLSAAAGTSIGTFWFLGLPDGETFQNIYSVLTPEVQRTLGEEQWMATNCGQCPGGCSLLVRRIEGRAKKVEGNPVFPVNKGNHCAKGEAALQGTYNPDRLTAPHRKENGTRKEISWKTAVNEITSLLTDLRSGKNQQALVISKPVRGHLRWVINRFSRQPTFLDPVFFDPFQDRVHTQTAADLFGANYAPAFRIERADLLVSFGVDFLETWQSPVRYSRKYGRFRQGDPDSPEGREIGRGTYIHVGPRLSMTASNADHWVPAAPGSERALATFLSRSMLESFSVSSTLRDKIKTNTEQKSLPEVADRCDVPARKIERMQKAITSADRPLFLGGGHTGAAPGGRPAVGWVQLLNGLAGNLNNTGGTAPSHPPLLEDLDSFQPKDTGATIPYSGGGFQQLEKVGSEVLDGNRSLDLLFVQDLNLVHQLPADSSFARCLREGEIGSIVYIGAFPDETAEGADYVLPAHTELERWEDDVPVPDPNGRTYAIGQPVLSPLHDTIHPGEVFLRLADGKKGPFQKVADKNTYESLLKKTLDRLYRQNRHRIPGVSREEFLQGLVEKGGWYSMEETDRWTPPPGEEPEALSIAVPAFLFQDEDSSFSGDPDRYPFRFMPYPSPLMGSGEGANKPWLQQAGDPVTSVAWDSWVEINPATAREMDLQEGDIVTVRSPHGAIEVPVYPYEGIRPDTVAVPAAQGHTSLGRYAKDRGANPISILAPRSDNASGQLLWMATRVRIEPTGRTKEISKIEGSGRELGPEVVP